MGAFATGLKYTAFGCLALVLLVALGIGTLGFVAAKQADGDPVREATTRWEPPELPATTADGAVHGIDLPQTPGVITLDLSGGGFEIEPAAPGEGLSIESTFRESNYELIEEYVESDGESPWHYTVTFRAKRQSVVTLVQSLMGKNKAELKVRVPPDLPYRLELQLDGGGMAADLGGLWLTELDLDVTKGGGAIQFSEPLRESLEVLELDCRMAGLAVVQLSNAAPEDLRIAATMGGVEIDLSGSWPHDTRASVFGKGSGAISLRMPNNVRVEGVPGALYRSEMPESPEVPAPVFRFSSDSIFDNVEFN